jgi:hypothetical protein
VYALAPRGVTVPGALRTISAGGIEAIVGTVPRPAKPTEAALRAHDRVLRELADGAPAILPVRFGTYFEDAGELELILRARQDTFRRALRAVRGRAQMTLRVAHPPVGNPLRADAPPSGSPLQDGSTGTAFLQARAAAAAQARAIPGFDPVRAAVRRWVRDERVEKHGRVASVYHLIPRGSVDAYRRGVMRAAEAAGLRVLVSGPFPPYAFATFF